MKCPLCNSSPAVMSKPSGVDRVQLQCPTCGNVEFSETAWVELGSLSQDEKARLKNYIQKSSASGHVYITHELIRAAIE